MVQGPEIRVPLTWIKRERNSSGLIAEIVVLQG